MNYEDLAKKMHEKSLELDQHLCELKKANDELRDRSATVLGALSALVGSVAQGPKTCNVCYSRPRQFALLPCGHATYCEQCSNRAMSRGRCFTCRQPIEQVVRIYL